MIRQPTPEQLKPLTLVEKAAYRVGDFCNNNLKTPLTWWNYTMMNILIWFGLSRRLHIHGLSHISEYNTDARVVLICNHRTFFDFFVISWVTFNKTKLPKRIFFPVRSTFFYTSWIGIPFSFFMGGYAMFPPIMREASKRVFNKYALQRIGDELRTQGCLVGFHPEGRRNKSNDPHSLLPAKRGVGEVYQEVPDATVVPVYIRGITNNLLREFWCNWFSAKSHPIDVHFGPPPECPELLGKEHTPETHQEIAEHCMQSIHLLAQQHKALRP
jgi:1-acyl-sn-glycerol-3-phosphate acyltransferase